MQFDIIISGNHFPSQPKHEKYYFEGEYCHVTCGKDGSGYEYTASHEKLVCHNHTWVTGTLGDAELSCTSRPCDPITANSATKPEIICSPTVKINNGNLNIDSSIIVLIPCYVEHYNEGTECRVNSCPPKYFPPLNNSRAICQDNVWGHELKCQLSQAPCQGEPVIKHATVTCNDNDHIENGYFYEGTICQFFCKSGYVVKPDSNAEVQCNSQKWESVHTCEKGLHLNDFWSFIFLF